MSTSTAQEGQQGGQVHAVKEVQVFAAEDEVVEGQVTQLLLLLHQVGARAVLAVHVQRTHVSIFVEAPHTIYLEEKLTNIKTCQSMKKQLVN